MTTNANTKLKMGDFMTCLVDHVQNGNGSHHLHFFHNGQLFADYLFKCFLKIHVMAIGPTKIDLVGPSEIMYMNGNGQTSNSNTIYMIHQTTSLIKDIKRRGP